MNDIRVCKSSDYSLVFKIASIIYEIINYLLLKIRLAIVYYYYTDLKLLNFVNELRIKRDLLLTVPESLQLFECAKAARKIKGDFAEVGIYRGGSAKILAEVKGKKKLHLFDTFGGLPKVSKKDKYFNPGQYSAPLDYAKNLLAGYFNLFFYKGVFPETIVELKKDIKFSFVHLDVDLYKSTKDCLEYFYPRMHKGGIILSHDYPSSVGAKRAVDEFMKDKPEAILKLSGNQGLIVKL